MRKKKRTKKRPEKREVLFLAGILCLLLLAGLILWNRNSPAGSSGLSDSVLQYEPLVKQYAQEYGIPGTKSISWRFFRWNLPDWERTSCSPPSRWAWLPAP